MQYSPLRRYDIYSVACFDPVTMMVVAGGAQLAGSAVSAMGTIAGGNAAKAAGLAGQQAQEFKAKQEEQAAQESRAVSQRAALDKRRQGDLALSTLQARAAASGGGAADPGVLTLAGDIAGRGEYEALFDMYKGENRARGLIDQAAGSRLTGEALRAEGEAKKRASRFSALGTIIGGVGSAASQFGGAPK